jgi:hypothetical protein
MPRQLPTGLNELLARKNKRLESHATLQLSVSGGALSQNYYFATAELNADGIVWQPQLRRAGAIKASLTRTATQVTLELQNVDTVLGIEFTQIQDFLFGATAKYGIYWRDLDSGAEFVDTMLTGVVAGLDVAQDVVTLSAVSEPYSSVSVGATRRVTRSCQWRFKQSDTCGYVGAETVCNLLINDAGGCQGRHGDPLKRAKFGGFAYIDSRAKLVTI